MTLKDRIDNLRNAVSFGLDNDKRNLIVDMDLLSEIFAGHVPVGNNELPPEDVTALLYEVKADRDRACRLVAEMHAAAVGEVTGPKVGVVEDVAAIRAELDRLRKLAESYDHQSHICGPEFEGVDEATDVIRILKCERDEARAEVDRRKAGVNAAAPRHEWSDEIDQLRVQLAGVLTAADGATSDPATRGMYGWSVAYQAVLDLRIKFDMFEATLKKFVEWSTKVHDLLPDGLFEEAIKLLEPPDAAYFSPEDPRWGKP